MTRRARRGVELSQEDPSFWGAGCDLGSGLVYCRKIRSGLGSGRERNGPHRGAEKTMRLQGGIFLFPESLLDQQGEALPGAEPFLSLMKMEGVTLYLVTGEERHQALEELERAGLSSFFKGLLSARDYGEGEAGPALCLRALRRMGTAPRATAVFTTQPDQREPLEQLAMFPVLVGPAARETGQGDGFIPDYREMIKAL